MVVAMPGGGEVELLSERRAAAAGGPRPIVGVSCCSRLISGAIFHTVFEKYVEAVDRDAGCTPILIPAIGDRTAAGDLASILSRLDGLLLTGGRSMVAPELYGGAPGDPEVLWDRRRDQTTIPLARMAVAEGVPLFAICRGLQELCCAFGGKLEPDLLSRDATIDHRARPNLAYEDKYRPSHLIHWQADGKVAGILARRGIPPSTPVNSLHVQGIAELPPNMVAEALADDGLIEAASVKDAPSFAFGVQWHPEWFVDEQPVNAALFREFGAACRARLGSRLTGVSALRADEGARRKV
jgi:putative glutamine amidotransferase